jgi:hypothetical protein
LALLVKGDDVAREPLGDAVSLSELFARLASVGAPDDVAPFDDCGDEVVMTLDVAVDEVELSDVASTRSLV